ncbi:MAG TPA: selenocysteine-specific translation elongation factor [Tissierellales bacterium]|nr:selenocysteine-specific translation elongation factor [Tissierellales bacterium]
MKHFIIGTAGHIDHGKTTLIKALTGRETDRLKEEKERGISIDLGFTFFDLPSGKRAGIVDVPGHEKFIKNMLAGTVGMDIVLLVIAADEGVMPQTVEHLAILDLLGVKKGFVVLTKTDLVEEEWLKLVIEDTRENLKGTFLEKSPIIPVSSTKKTGIKEAIKLIDEMADEVEERDIKDMPRLPVDRVFSISGFGTVVTGTLISGTFQIGDEVQIFPGNKIGRIRNLQVHDKDNKKAYSGQRVAINIAGLKKADINRGDVIAPADSMKDTMMLDVSMRLLNSIPRPIKNRTRLRLYVGTKEVLCRIVLLDKEELTPGESAYAQLRLEERVVAKRGDKFVLRYYSPMFTIGGGEILEANPTKKKRYDERALEELKIKDKGDYSDIIERIILDKSFEFPTLKDISVYTVKPEDRIEREIEKLKEKNKVVVFKLSKDMHVIHIDYFNKIKDEILKELKIFHSNYPLRSGMQKEELRVKYIKGARAKVADNFIDLLEKEEYIKQENENVRLKGFKVEYTEKQLEIKKFLLDKFDNSGLLPLNKEKVFHDMIYSVNEAEQVFTSLVDEKLLIKLKEDIYIKREIYEEAADIVKKYIKENKYITVGQCRDLLDTNRKVSIALLEYLDYEKITKRVKDKRYLLN